MDNERFLKQIEFIIEADKIKKIVRNNYLSDGSRKENDAEHSWHLGLTVMVLSEYFEGLDVGKTLKMVLAHDLVEIYAGDVYAYDEKGNEGKFEREKESAEKLFSILPQDQKKEFYDLWIEFEEAETKEALCSAIVDRIQPLILNYFTEGKSWKEHNISSDKVMGRNKIVFEKGPEIIGDYVKSLIESGVKKGYLK